MFIDYLPCKRCRNPDSYGMICVRCGKCGRKFDRNGSLLNGKEYPGCDPMRRMKKMGDKNSKRFTLELTENQLRAVQDSLEEYCRIRMNQWDLLADDLAEKTFDLSPDNPNHKGIFNEYITTRSHVKVALEAVGKMLWNTTRCTVLEKTDEQLIAEDIWRVIRHRFYLESGSTDTSRVDAYPPIHVSKEPVPICGVKTSEKEDGSP